MNDTRPINLDLRTLKYPPMAMVSILHRISGLFLFLLLPLFIYFFQLSLQSPQSFARLQVLWMNGCFRFLIWVFCSALMCHLLAGIRHLFMDLGWGEALNTARNSALVVIFLTIISVSALGVWLW